MTETAPPTYFGRLLQRLPLGHRFMRPGPRKPGAGIGKGFEHSTPPKVVRVRDDEASIRGFSGSCIGWPEISCGSFGYPAGRTRAGMNTVTSVRTASLMGPLQCAPDLSRRLPRHPSRIRRRFHCGHSGRAASRLLRKWIRSTGLGRRCPARSVPSAWTRFDNHFLVATFR